jgi:hypothetical protein
LRTRTKSIGREIGSPKARWYGRVIEYSTDGMRYPVM